MRIFFAVLLAFCLVEIASGQTVNGSVTLTATASDITSDTGDTECGVASVQFFNGGAGLSPIMTAPTAGNNYVFNWDTKSVPNGTYVITAVAKDKAGPGTTPANTCDSTKQNVATSNPITVVVDNKAPDGTAPSITITITVTVTP